MILSTKSAPTFTFFVLSCHRIRLLNKFQELLKKLKEQCNRSQIHLCRNVICPQGNGCL